MTPQFLITGGTGTLGRRVLPLLRPAGPVRVLTRRPHDPTDGVEYTVGDLSTGEGVAQAAEGVSTILHLAGGAKGDDHKATHLVRVTGPRTHIVFISVVGADRVPMTGRIDRAMFGYFAGQRAAEQVIEESGRPWTTLRATQFHDLMLLVATRLAKLPVIPVPAGLRFQLVDAGEVAARLVDLALGPPRGLVEDLAGPRALGMDELLRSYLRATGKRRLLVPVRLPGRAYAAIRAGANLSPAHAGTAAGVSWAQFLAGSLSSAAPAGGATGR